MKKTAEQVEVGVASRLVELLDEKNQYLQRFFDLNETELGNFSEGVFENVEPFYQAREQILNTIRNIDGLVHDVMTKAPLRDLPSEKLPQIVRAELEEIMAEKEQLAKMILAQDLEVLAAIESEKSKIIRELRETTKAKTAVSAYKSGSRTSMLDEKA